MKGAQGGKMKIEEDVEGSAHEDFLQGKSRGRGDYHTVRRRNLINGHGNWSLRKKKMEGGGLKGSRDWD